MLININKFYLCRSQSALFFVAKIRYGKYPLFRLPQSINMLFQCTTKCREDRGTALLYQQTWLPPS